jgi:hypothetical protein
MVHRNERGVRRGGGRGGQQERDMANEEKAEGKLRIEETIRQKNASGLKAFISDTQTSTEIRVGSSKTNYIYTVCR